MAKQWRYTRHIYAHPVPSLLRLLSCEMPLTHCGRLTQVLRAWEVTSGWEVQGEI